MAPAIKCLIVLAIVALLFITELIPLAITAMSGAIACGLLGFIPAKQVFSGLSDSTVVLFAGMFVLVRPCSILVWHRKSVFLSLDSPVPAKTV